MQIRVGTTGDHAEARRDLANLQAVWAKTDTKRGVFEVTQEPIIIPQARLRVRVHNPSFPRPAGSTLCSLNGLEGLRRVGDLQRTGLPPSWGSWDCCTRTRKRPCGMMMGSWVTSKTPRLVSVLAHTACRLARVTSGFGVVTWSPRGSA